MTTEDDVRRVQRSVFLASRWADGDTAPSPLADVGSRERACHKSTFEQAAAEFPDTVPAGHDDDDYKPTPLLTRAMVAAIATSAIAIAAAGAILLSIG